MILIIIEMPAKQMPLSLFAYIFIFNKAIVTVIANNPNMTMLFRLLQLNPSLHPHPNLFTKILFKGS